uniref:Uncharacterized protein n=1 Tax=Arundo donax TaxID=35708 RepID=A0A0A8ZYN4_ARUDO
MIFLIKKILQYQGRFSCIMVRETVNVVCQAIHFLCEVSP